MIIATVFVPIIVEWIFYSCFECDDDKFDDINSW